MKMFNPRSGGRGQQSLIAPANPYRKQRRDAYWKEHSKTDKLKVMFVSFRTPSFLGP